MHYAQLSKVRFFIVGGWGGLGGGVGGWVSGPGLRRGWSLVNCLQIGEGQTCFTGKRGRVTVFFWEGKKLLHVG